MTDTVSRVFRWRAKLNFSDPISVPTVCLAFGVNAVAFSLKLLGSCALIKLASGYDVCGASVNEVLNVGYALFS